MGPRRIIALASDDHVANRLVAALEPVGPLDLHRSLATLNAALAAGDVALVVIHLDGDLAGVAPVVLARLTGATALIAILPRANLTTVVDLMRSSERVAGMMIAEALEPHEVAVMARRVLRHDVHGLASLAPAGTQIHRATVVDYATKSACIEEIAAFAERVGARRKYRESIDTCVDEMLMNALYDAPVDEDGRPLFAEAASRRGLLLPDEQRVVVEYAAQGSRFFVSVRDAFGTLERATVLRYLHKCLHSAQQIDRKAGGAGLGLYVMTSSATQVLFQVLPGLATEAMCVFDLKAPRQQLAGFGFFHGEPPVLASPAPSATPRGVVLALIAAIVLTLALIAVVATRS